MPEAPKVEQNDPDVVLVVEDEVIIRMHISEYLRDCGYRVIEAANADEAVLLLSEPEIRIDLVFTDVEMPGSMDGFALANWVRSNRPGLGVILAGTPARATDAAADLCQSGPDLAKPYEPQLVLERIRRLLGERESGAKKDQRGATDKATPG
jgi:DNA-binding NtrC family response regulator